MNGSVLRRSPRPTILKANNRRNVAGVTEDLKELHRTIELSGIDCGMNRGAERLVRRLPMQVVAIGRFAVVFHVFVRVFSTRFAT